MNTFIKYIEGTWNSIFNIFDL